jgi:hypothetical protein
MTIPTQAVPLESLTLDQLRAAAGEFDDAIDGADPSELWSEPVLAARSKRSEITAEISRRQKDPHYLDLDPDERAARDRVIAALADRQWDREFDEEP